MLTGEACCLGQEWGSLWKGAFQGVGNVEPRPAHHPRQCSQRWQILETPCPTRQLLAERAEQEPEVVPISFALVLRRLFGQ
jgi:hypothetical protein